MQENANTASNLAPTAVDQPIVRENVAEELSQLRNDLWRVAHEVRMKSKGASAEVKSSRAALEREVERFSEQVKGAAEEAQEDLKQIGEDLRMRLQKLVNQIVMPPS